LPQVGRRSGLQGALGFIGALLDAVDALLQFVHLHEGLLL
jgi:hypothetical protein